MEISSEILMRAGAWFHLNGKLCGLLCVYNKNEKKKIILFLISNSAMCIWVKGYCTSKQKDHLQNKCLLLYHIVTLFAHFNCEFSLLILVLIGQRK